MADPLIDRRMLERLRQSVACAEAAVNELCKCLEPFADNFGGLFPRAKQGSWQHGMSVGDRIRMAKAIVMLSEELERSAANNLPTEEESAS